MIEWNQDNAKTSFLYLPFSDANLTLLNLSSYILLYNLDIFALSPVGGSVVTLNEFYKTEIGNFG